MSSAAARIEALSNQLQGALRKGELPTAAEWPVPTLRDVPPLDTPDNWNGAVLEKQTDKYAIRLSDAVIAELEASIASFLATGTPLAHMSRESFPLGEATKALLDRVRNQLFDGFGFALLRGLPVDRWTRTQTAACTLGVGVHLGLLQVQNKLGHTLGHVKDLGRDPNDPTVRYYATRERQQFHTDGERYSSTYFPSQS